MSRKIEQWLDKLYRELEKKEDVTLDDIGFVGSQYSYGETEWKKIVRKTGQIIRARRTGDKSRR